MDKINLVKQFKDLYNPSAKEFTVVEVPTFNFLMVDGKGNPNTSQEYREAIETLYTVSYTLKFMIKKSMMPADYAVMPLEGLWWADDMSAFLKGDKDRWKWTAMILQPPNLITEAAVKDAVEQVRKKKNPPALPKLRFEKFAESLSVQIMYFGPYADEGPTIARMHDFIRTNGYAPTGKHHEIYLGDPRKSAPEKLKTVIRQPIKKA